jgi:hypothetical protein
LIEQGGDAEPFHAESRESARALHWQVSRNFARLSHKPGQRASEQSSDRRIHD